MARERRRHARGAEGLEAVPATAGVSGPAPQPRGKGKAKPAQDGSPAMAQDRALFLHLIRALAREAARADDVDDSTRAGPRA